jgi:hypothetical protein
MTVNGPLAEFCVDDSCCFSSVLTLHGFVFERCLVRISVGISAILT